MKAALPLLLLCTGCAFGPGEPFATLTPSLEARLHLPAGRGNPSTLSNDYVVLITRFDVEYSEARLVDLNDAQAAGFDPASPPEGYTICHNGHCDREDGALVTYAEVAAESAGGAGASEVAHVLVGAVNQLGEARPLECEDTCELPPASVDLVKLGVLRFVIEGEVSDGRAVKRLVGVKPFTLQYEATGETDLSAEVELKVDRHSSTRVALTLRPLLGPALLDGVEFSGPLDSQEVKAQLTENLVTRRLDVAVER